MNETSFQINSSIYPEPYKKQEKMVRSANQLTEALSNFYLNPVHLFHIIIPMNEQQQICKYITVTIFAFFLSLAANQVAAQGAATDCVKLRDAITDLIETFGSRYTGGADYW